MFVRSALRVGWLCLVVLAIGQGTAGASVLIHLSFDEMAEKSSAVLLGRCVEVRSAWNADRSDIVTHNVFEVREYYKGSLGRRVTITEPGGQVGNVVAAYTGIPRFRVGEEAVLFVWTDPFGTHTVIGLTQGKFHVRRDTLTGELMLQQSFSDEPMLEPPAHSHTEPVASLAFPMAAFRSAVSATLLKRKGARQ